MDQLRTYSFVLLSVLLIVAGIVYTLWSMSYAFGGVLTIVTGGLLVVLFVVARRGLPTPANPEKRIRKARGGWRPVVVHFYSDLDLFCLLKRPFTVALEREYRSRFDWIYISMLHPEAAAAAASVEASLGDFVLIDGSGQVAERSGTLSRAALDQLLEHPVRN